MVRILVKRIKKFIIILLFQLQVKLHWKVHSISIKLVLKKMLIYSNPRFQHINLTMKIKIICKTRMYKQYSRQCWIEDNSNMGLNLWFNIYLPLCVVAIPKPTENPYQWNHTISTTKLLQNWLKSLISCIYLDNHVKLSSWLKFC